MPRYSSAATRPFITLALVLIRYRQSTGQPGGSLALPFLPNSRLDHDLPFLSYNRQASWDLSQRFGRTRPQTPMHAQLRGLASILIRVIEARQSPLISPTFRHRHIAS
ncbi:hypothetical protein V8C40DRAFT_233246 [Trichoderma camerunense]